MISETRNDTDVPGTEPEVHVTPPPPMPLETLVAA